MDYNNNIAFRKKRAHAVMMQTDKGLALYEKAGLYIANQKRVVDNYSSPLHDDKNPSFSLNIETLLWYDHAVGAGGNALTLLYQLYGEEGGVAIAEQVYQIEGFKKVDYKPIKPKIKTKPKSSKKVVKRELKWIKFHDDFPTIDLERLAERGITKEALVKSETKPLRGYCEILTLDDGTTFEAKPVYYMNDAFAWQIAPNTYRVRTLKTKKTRSLPNMVEAKELYGEDYQPIIGAGSLDTTKPVFRMAGEWDFLSALSQGINAYTTGAEAANYCKAEQDLVGNAPERHVCFDTDFSGLHAMNGLKEQYGFNPIILPLKKQEYKPLPAGRQPENKNKVAARHYTQNKQDKTWRIIDANNPLLTKPKLNDFCDYIARYGYAYQIKRLFEKEAVEYSFDKYIMDMEKPVLEELYTNILLRQKNILELPTGGGKTTIALSRQGFYGFFRKTYPDAIFIFTAPLHAVCEQVGKKYSEFQLICDGHTSAHQADFRDSIVTYNSLIPFFKRIEEAGLAHKTYIVQDEIHEAVLASTYQNTSEIVDYIADKSMGILGLSATIQALKPYFEAKNFVITTAERRKSPIVNVKAKIVIKEQVINEIVDFAQKHKNEKTLYFRDLQAQNYKGNVRNIKKAIQQSGINCEAVWGGMPISQKNKLKAYNYLIENETLPDNCKHLVATRVLATGVSAHVDNIVIVTDKNKKDIVSFLQTYARDRSEVINVTLFIVQNNTTEGAERKPFNYVNIESEAKKYGRVVKEWNALLELRNQAIDRLRDTKEFSDADINDLFQAPMLANNKSTKLNRYVYQCKLQNQYKVSDARIACDEYERLCKETDTKNYIIAIKNSIKNLNFSWDESQADDYWDIVTSVEEASNEQLRNDIDTISTLLKDKQTTDAVAEYVYQNSEGDSMDKALLYFSKILRNDVAMFSTPKKKRKVIFADILNSEKPQTDFIQIYKDSIDALKESVQDFEDKYESARSESQKTRYKIRFEKTKIELRRKETALKFLEANAKETIKKLLERNLPLLHLFFSRYYSVQKTFLEVIPKSDLVDMCLTYNNSEYGLKRKRLFHNANIAVAKIYNQIEVLRLLDVQGRTKSEIAENDAKIVKMILPLIGQKICSQDLLKALNRAMPELGITDKNLAYHLKPLFNFKRSREGIITIDERLDLERLMGSKIYKAYIDKFERLSNEAQERYIDFCKRASEAKKEIDYIKSPF